MKVNDQFLHRICGKLLGDGCITKQERRKPRFQFIHRTEDLRWVEYCYLQLKDFIPLSAPVYRKVIDGRLEKGFSERYTVQSRTHPIITKLHQTWYPAGKKEVPFEFLARYLNEEALSWWYQDDGHLKVVKGKICKVILSTESFTLDENKLLIELLLWKFRLRFATDGQNRLILYDQFQIIHFLNLVSPWMNNAMDRKALVNLPLRPIAKRTTIYLPSSIHIAKPTADINDKLKNLERLISSESKIICHTSIFKQFQQLSMDQSTTTAYQIVVQDAHRETLASIRQQTGLTISQLVAYCFSY